MAEQQNSMDRPESTVAQSFASDLDSMFGLGEGVDALSQNVADKKKEVNTGQSELEKLEAKLRETEQRLAKAGGPKSASPLNPQANTAAARAPERAPPQPPHGGDERPGSGATRPPAHREDTQKLMAGMPGAMPGTPGRQHSGRDDYVMVDNGRGAR